MVKNVDLKIKGKQKMGRFVKGVDCPVKKGDVKITGELFVKGVN